MHTGNDAGCVRKADDSNSCQKLLQWSPSRSRALAPPTCPWRPRCASASKQHPEEPAPQSWMASGGPSSPHHICGPQAWSIQLPPGRASPPAAAPQVRAAPCSLPPPFSPHPVHDYRNFQPFAEAQGWPLLSPDSPQPSFN